MNRRNVRIVPGHAFGRMAGRNWSRSFAASAMFRRASQSDRVLDPGFWGGEHLVQVSAGRAGATRAKSRRTCQAVANEP
jgi:hypothetical protein